MTSMTETHILVIEDEPDLRSGLKHNLELEGYTVDTAADGREGLRKAREGKAALVLLDLMLPLMSGLEVLRHLREIGREIPVIIISAKGQDRDKVQGLELGADDYLTKPFSLAELMARVKALLRRADLLHQAQANAGAAGSTIRNGELEIHPGRRSVRWGGTTIDCTAREFDLLLHFAQHPGHVFSRSQLLASVWGYTHDGYEHTVTTHINRLRAKLEADPMQPALILTVRGAGYKLRDAP